MGRFWRRERAAPATGAAAAPAPEADAAARALALRIAEERERIYADLHDDLGAKLLELAYVESLDAARAIGREALDDLRDIVSRTQAVRGTLAEVLEMVRDEALRRLAARGVELAWQIDAATVPAVALDDSQALHLFRIFREAISNALRHAHPQRLRVRMFADADAALFDITDDGPGIADREGSGRGTRSIAQRARQLGGQAAWEAGTEGGTKVVLRMPLRN